MLTTGKGAESRGGDDHRRGAADDDEAPEEEEDDEEVFSQARDTEATGDEPDEAAERADGDGQRSGAEAVLSPASPPVLGGPSASGSPRRETGSGRERRGKYEDGESEEEWCAGHVCLRLRPDGLRERRSRMGDGNGGTRRDTGGNGAEEASGSDDGSVSASDGEVRVLHTRVVI